MTRAHEAVATRTDAAAPKADQEKNQEQICSVRVGDDLFGIRITPILEIVGGARPQTVPLAPAFVGGLVHYRGDVLTTVSLRSLLGLPQRDGAQDLLVVENPSGFFGLLVDSVVEVLKLSSADYEPNPSTMRENRRALFAGVYKLENGLLIMLDPACLEPMHLARFDPGAGGRSCAH
ncbi:MAG TPA: chemotaxis protein CheW [Terracidiphilus sp.]|nr:chemotaxis protein CheW [Terracidiphilus sp.]